MVEEVLREIQKKEKKKQQRQKLSSTILSINLSTNTLTRDHNSVGSAGCKYFSIVIISDIV